MKHGSRGADHQPGIYPKRSRCCTNGNALRHAYDRRMATHSQHFDTESITIQYNATLGVKHGQMATLQVPARKYTERRRSQGSYLSAPDWKCVQYIMRECRLRPSARYPPRIAMHTCAVFWTNPWRLEFACTVRTLHRVSVRHRAMCVPPSSIPMMITPQRTTPKFACSRYAYTSRPPSSAV